LASLGFVSAAVGFPDKARRVLDELVAQSQRRHVSAYWLAVIHAGLDQRHLALEALKAAFMQREPQLLWVSADPRLAGLRSEPEFLALRRHLRFD
jgi:hypothetical protein